MPNVSIGGKPQPCWRGVTPHGNCLLERNSEEPAQRNLSAEPDYQATQGFAEPPRPGLLRHGHISHSVVMRYLLEKGIGDLEEEAQLYG